MLEDDPTVWFPRPDDERRRRRFRLMVAVPTLLVAVGLAGVGVVVAGQDTPPDRIVIASGEGIDPEAVTTTVSPPQPPPPPPTVAPTTTVAPPPASTTSTTVRRATTTTRPAPTTTRPTTPPTSVATASQAMVTLWNNYSEAVQLKVNGVAYELAAGQRVGPVAVTPAPSGNDTIELRLSSNPTCGEGDAMGYFVAGRRYLLTVSVSSGSCSASPTSPKFQVTPA